MTRSMPFILALVVALASPSLHAKTVRAGLFVGSNVGNFTEDPLFYAAEDAVKMYFAFVNFGGLDPRLAKLLKGADKKELKRSLTELQQRIALVREQPDTNVECVFYYSGHGGADGLHLAGDLFSHKRLHQSLEGLSCDLLLVILDACSSGEFLRVKGVTFSPEEFRVKMYDTKKGEVFITSSASSEYSQEKDELKGSVFTYHLVNGLLGSADANRDDRITLAEAYDYTSRKTVQETFGSARGFHVPHYNYQVQGSRETVLTELRGNRRSVDVPAGFRGIVTFMDQKKGLIWGDFKVGGHAGPIAVPEGQYVVRLRDPEGALSLAQVKVRGDGSAVWQEARPIKEDDDPLKGRRVLHHWGLRMAGDVLLSPDRAVMHTANYGGRIDVILDNVGIVPLYLGLSTSITTGARAERVFDTPVEHRSILFHFEALVGLRRRFTSLFELAGDVRLGGGYAILSRQFRGKTTDTTGFLFDTGVWGHVVWWVSRDIGIAAPSLHCSLLGYRDGGAMNLTVVAGLSAGLQLAF